MVSTASFIRPLRVKPGQIHHVASSATRMYMFRCMYTLVKAYHGACLMFIFLTTLLLLPPPPLPTHTHTHPRLSYSFSLASPLDLPDTAGGSHCQGEQITANLLGMESHTFSSYSYWPSTQSFYKLWSKSACIFSQKKSATWMAQSKRLLYASGVESCMHEIQLSCYFKPLCG